MKINELVFPVTPEALAAYQEAGMGRSLYSNEREALAAWVPVLNMSYEDGCAGDKNGLLESVDRLDGLIHRSEGNPVLLRFLKACRLWTVYAWKQGREGATQ